MLTLRGVMNDQRQPIISITVRGTQSKERTADALLDTGFNGTMVLPPDLILELGLPFWFIRTVVLADGSMHDISNHKGRILWEGVERPIRIAASGDQPLIGMGLLVGYRLQIDAVDGGAVIVEPI